MDYNDSRLIDQLAAQYALGTLRGPARRRFERLCRENGAAVEAVRRWEDRLLQLASQIVPVKPSAAVWAGIKRRITRGAAAPAQSPEGWRRWTLAASAIVAIALIGWWTLLGPPSTQLVATIQDQQQTQLWRIEAQADRHKLFIAATPALSADAQHAYELWALSPRAGGAPVSLGLMPQRGERALRLTPAQRDALANARQVAVSLEPIGGSPTGAPTGPVLFVAPVSGAPG